MLQVRFYFFTFPPCGELVAAVVFFPLILCSIIAMSFVFCTTRLFICLRSLYILSLVRISWLDMIDAMNSFDSVRKSSNASTYLVHASTLCTTPCTDCPPKPPPRLGWAGHAANGAAAKSPAIEW